MKRDHSDKALASFLAGFGGASGPTSLPSYERCSDPMLHELVVACLAWNAPRAGVADALARLHESTIDYNELRVMIPEHLVEIIGPKYPHAEERCVRLRAALNAVFNRENGMMLSHLRERNKRDAKAYLDELPGLPAYAASRVALVCCEVHTFPVDSTIHAMFDSAGVIEEGTDEAALAALLERTLRAGEAVQHFWGLEAAALENPVRAVPSRAKKPASKKKAKRTPKKTASKTPAATKTAKKKSASEPASKPTKRGTKTA